MTGSRRRLFALLLAVGAVGGSTLGLLAHVAFGTPDRDGPALPELHGQASWASGTHKAPSFRLRDQSGSWISLKRLRGRPVLLTFFDSRCVEQCPVTGKQLARVLRRLAPRERPTIVIVSVNPRGDTSASIRHATRAWDLEGPWRLHWVGGKRPALARVWRSYGITVQPTTNDVTHGLALYLIDRQGFQRTGYLFPFLPNFVGLDLVRLAREEA